MVRSRTETITLCLLKRKKCEFQYDDKLGKRWKKWFILCSWPDTCNQQYVTSIYDLRPSRNQEKMRKILKPPVPHFVQV